eukprot:355336-Karenia_brevis.AAC.1
MLAAHLRVMPMRLQPHEPAVWAGTPARVRIPLRAVAALALHQLTGCLRVRARIRSSGHRARRTCHSTAIACSYTTAECRESSW